MASLDRPDYELYVLFQALKIVTFAKVARC